ncbi:hypothetical protein N2152v2_005246 [Parachlorella kessleri]
MLPRVTDSWVASLGSCVPAMFRLRKVTLYLFLLLTAIMMVDASKIYDNIYLVGVGDYEYRKRLKVYFAGLIMFLIGDFLWIIYAGLMDGREGDDHQSSGAHFDPRSPTPAGYPNYGAPPPTKAAAPAGATTGIRQGGTPVSPEPGMTYSPGGVTSHTVAYAQGPGANV